MGKLQFVMGLLAVVFVVESICQARFIHPTYRPPPRPRQPILRTARAAGDDPQPQWLWQGDDVIRAPSTGEHPFLPSIIDDVRLNPNTRYARSLILGGDESSNLIGSVDHKTAAQDPYARFTRSLSTPGHGRIGSNDRGNSGSRSQGTDASHPGPANNRRTARSSGLPDFATTPPFNPKPWPGFPKPNRSRFPIYV